jgi:hypothetical protein
VSGSDFAAGPAIARTRRPHHHAIVGHIMLYNCFLKKGVVYVPTVAKLQTGAYTDIEPVAVVPVSNTESLRRAFLDAIARKNAIVPNPPKDAAGLAKIRGCEDLVGVRARCSAMEYQRKRRKVPNRRASNA